MSVQVAVKASQDAVLNIGVQEEGVNSGKYVNTYQQACDPKLPDGSPWCMAFVVFRFKKAAHSLNKVIRSDWPRSGYCPHHYRWALNNGYFIHYVDASTNPTVIKPGYIALFYSNVLGRIAHTGIVVAVHEWGVETVEGNTSAPPRNATEVDREGDGVYMKSRKWAQLGLYGGFVNTHEL
jgi:hypothetical protein